MIRQKTLPAIASSMPWCGCTFSSFSRNSLSVHATCAPPTLSLGGMRWRGCACTARTSHWGGIQGWLDWDVLRWGGADAFAKVGFQHAWCGRDLSSAC